MVPGDEVHPWDEPSVDGGVTQSPTAEALPQVRASESAADNREVTAQPRHTPPDHQRCTARSKRSGERCRHYKTPGSNVCAMHGSASPQARAKAQRRLEQHRMEGEVSTLLTELGVDADTNPIESLLEAHAHAATMARLLRELVGGLNPMHDRADVDELGRIKAALFGPDHLDDAKPHVLVQMLGEWTDRAARIAKVTLDANIDERLARITEAQVVTLQVIFERLRRDFVALLVEHAVANEVVDLIRGERFNKILAGRLREIDTEGKSLDP
jgi:hypothetical protein